MSDTNAWDRVLGPFYADTYLERHDVDMEGLIGLQLEGGEVVYPHAQFDQLDDGVIKRREAVIEMWNKLIRPAIEEGYADEWTATILLLQETPDHPSRAEEISRNPQLTGEVAQSIQRALNGWRQ